MEYKKIAVLAAMAEELNALRSAVQITDKFVCGKTNIEQANYHGVPLLIVESGIGKVNAAIATTILMEKYKPDLIINIGSAGAVDASLQIADVIVGSEFIYADVDLSCFGYAKGQLPQMPEKFSIRAELKEQLQTIINNTTFPFKVALGQILTSDSFIQDPQLQLKRKTDFPAGVVVEMESAAVAHVASFYAVDVLAFRSISDAASAGAATSFEQNLAKAALSATEFLLFLLKQAYSN